MLALGTIFAQIKFFELPNGGSVTFFSMLPFILVTFRHGTKWGLLTALCNAILQFVLGKPYAPPAGTAFAFFLMILLDYLLAFLSTGLANIFAAPFKKTTQKVFFGITGVFVVRFLMAFLSGVLLWGSYADPGQSVYVFYP